MAKEVQERRLVGACQRGYGSYSCERNDDSNQMGRNAPLLRADANRDE